MKTYKFPYGGAEWDSFVEFELTDEEAGRLEASAKAKPRWHLDEDETISDICKKIELFICEENKRMMKDDGRLEEARETWKYFHKDSDEEYMPSDDELIDQEMGMWHVCYPEPLQDLKKRKSKKTY